MTTNSKYYDSLANGDPEKVAGAFWRLNKYLKKRDSYFRTQLKPNGVVYFSGMIYIIGDRYKFRELWYQYGFQVHGIKQKTSNTTVGWHDNNHQIKPQ